MKLNTVMNLGMIGLSIMSFISNLTAHNSQGMLWSFNTILWVLIAWMAQHRISQLQSFIDGALHPIVEKMQEFLAKEEEKQNKQS